MRIYGELLQRIQKNRERLSAEEYCAPRIFREGGSWPGDWQGRTLLALCCHLRLAENESARSAVAAQIDGILSGLDAETNEGGYFGEPFGGGILNEQQLSGNSWFLRGLCMYYEMEPRPEILSRLRRISHSLLEKLAPYYENYPLTAREETGGVDGHLEDAVVGGWRLSSDVGTAFMLLDGITHVYAVLREDALLPAIDAMIAKFAEVDHIGMHTQTHATLTGTRGVLRMYGITGKKEYLHLAERNFRLYAEQGMTLNYANFNWFGKPWWTEPCAVVDSMMAAQQLYAYTGGRQYLVYLNRIYANAFRTAQRPDGGAGCETCLCEENDSLKNYLYEAYFCCTMRIAEGFCSLAENAFIYSGGKCIVPLLIDAENGGLSVRPEERSSGVRVSLQAEGTLPSVSLYVPDDCIVTDGSGRNVPAQGGMIEICPCEGGQIFNIEYLDHIETRRNTPVHMRGDWLMMTRERGGTDRERVRDVFLLPGRKAVEEAEQFI